MSFARPPRPRARPRPPRSPCGPERGAARPRRQGAPSGAPSRTHRGWRADPEGDPSAFRGRGRRPRRRPSGEPRNGGDDTLHQDGLRSEGLALLLRERPVGCLLEGSDPLFGTPASSPPQPANSTSIPVRTSSGRRSTRSRIELSFPCLEDKLAAEEPHLLRRGKPAPDAMVAGDPSTSPVQCLTFTDLGKNMSGRTVSSSHAAPGERPRASIIPKSGLAMRDRSGSGRPVPGLRKNSGVMGGATIASPSPDPGRRKIVMVRSPPARSAKA